MILSLTGENISLLPWTPHTYDEGNIIDYKKKYCDKIKNNTFFHP
jgi:hypothetical protein